MMSESKTDNQAVLKSLRYSVAKPLSANVALGSMQSSLANGKLTRLQPEEIKPLAAAEDQASYNSK